MNPCEPLISNNYIVDESIIDECIQKKDELIKERTRKADFNILYTIAITAVYYLEK